MHLYKSEQYHFCAGLGLAVRPLRSVENRLLIYRFKVLDI